MARHSVGVGDLPRRDDDDAVLDALRRAFGGHEPSGGRWQRIALARGLMRTDPLLLVLDEPTANVDPPPSGPSSSATRAPRGSGRGRAARSR